MSTRQRTRNKSKRRGFRNANTFTSKTCRAVVEGLSESIIGESIALDYLRSEYLRKYTGPGTSSDRERREAAIEKWRSQEQLNADTNQRLSMLDPGYNILPRIGLSTFLRTCRRYISDVLGDLGSSPICFGNFTGGASTGRDRTMSSPAHKFIGLADVTRECSYLVDHIHRNSEFLRQGGFFYNLQEVEGAILFTVPKTSEIDRCACKEPEINMFLQKGVGSHIRRNLRKFGINLNDQSVNKRLAKLGSETNLLSTIDLSSASDSVTTGLVKLLLPHEWFLYLDDIRSQFVRVDEELIRTEMFSSMGNGFTFELESLIFWSIARSVAYFRGHRGSISIYGDDIIFPSEGYDDLVFVLSIFGFRTNEDKSFSDGPFRESCGGHYHYGNDITPFYLRREAKRLTDVIRVANQLRFWAETDPYRQYEHDNLFRLWS